MSKTIVRFVSALALAAGLSGAAQAAGPAADAAVLEAYIAKKPAPLQPYYRSLYNGGERNAVLNYERLGLAAIEAGLFADAEQAFDGALTRIEAIYAKNPQADAARNLFKKESNKPFKGEPYERAMAYYYRGLLHLRTGDYDNARASFKSAQFQDSMSEQEEFKSDFAMMDYLSGWAAQCAGSRTAAADDFAAAAAAAPGLTAPAATDNVLMIAEMGVGPRKVKDGGNREKLTFAAVGGAPEEVASYTFIPAKGKPMVYELKPVSSVYYQATTRGGRAIDGVLAGKASWKAGTEAVGSVAMNTGLALAQQGYGEAGMYAAAAGAIFSMFSSAMKPDADTRMWDTLPDHVGLRSAKLAGADWKTEVAYRDGKGGPVTLAAQPVLLASANACTLVWTRSRSVMGAGPDAIGDDANVARKAVKDKKIKALDQSFRAQLVAL